MALVIVKSQLEPPKNHCIVTSFAQHTHIVECFLLSVVDLTVAYCLLPITVNIGIFGYPCFWKGM